MFKINKNIYKSNTLPSEFYADDKIFEKLRTNIFEKSWQLILSKKEITNLTTYPFTYFDGFIDENLVITNNSNKLKCLSNICTHRGHVVSLCKNKNNILKCKYHGRTFNLNGTLKNAPGFDNAIDFPTSDDNLVEIPITEWNDFLFISLDPNTEVNSKLKQIDRFLPNFPYNELIAPPNTQEYIIDCHWSLYCDNYLEGFHVPHVHKGLNDDINWKKYKTKILDEIVLQIAESKTSDNSINYNQEKNIYAYYFFVFPNIMINYYKWGISINIIEPISKEKTRIKYMIYPIKGENIPQDSPSSLDKVELEDQEVILSVQKGIRSRYYKAGRFSPEMEEGVHYFHRLINEKISV